MGADPEPPGARAGLLVGLSAFALLVFLASRSTLWDRDEPRFAQATVEMLASRDWLVPTFDHEVRPDKPILVYWLMAGSMRVLGTGAVALRLVSALCAAATVVLVAHAGRRLFGGAAGVWAACALSTSLLFVVEGSVATTDALLLLCESAALLLYVRHLGREIGLGAALLLGVLLGLAQLTKGPVGLVVPALSLGCAHLLLVRGGGGPGPARRLGRAMAVAVPVSVALFLLWALPAHLASDGEFLRVGLGRHVLERAQTPLEGHGGNWFLTLPYYVPVVLLGFAPWCAFLPLAWVAARADDAARSDHAATAGWRVSAAWALGSLAFMTLVATKLPHYVLPAWPALALLCGAAIARAGPRPRWALRTAAALIALTALVECAGLLVAPRALHAPEIAWLAASPVPFVAGAGLWGARCALRGDLQRAARVLLAGRVAFFALLGLLVLPAVEATKVSPRIAAAIRAATPDDVPVARSGYAEPSLDFYLGRPPIRELGGDADLAAWLREPGRAVLVVPEGTWARVASSAAARDARVLCTERGFNLSKGRAVSLVAVERGGP